MSLKSDEYLKNVPLKSYDLIKEGLAVFISIAIIIFALALIFGSPDYPPVTAKQIAKYETISYLKTFINILEGKSSISDYGPPYDSDTSQSQNFFGIKPSVILGVTTPINPIDDFIINPLEKIAIFDNNLKSSLEEYKNATNEQKLKWVKSYDKALENAKIENNNVIIPNGDYGPIKTMMNSLFKLGLSGLLEGSIVSSNSPYDFYNMNFTKPLLLFQGKVYHSVAKQLDMLGEDWGISNETGNYPGAWWLWPYTLAYQLPPMSTSSNGDLQVGILMMTFFLVLLLFPYLPLLNKIPKFLKIYKIIWRDWYKNQKN
ncbi:hypothetical protein TDSAC_0984 [Thermodesulfobium acidiphilum]|uniref:Uncharacterized protein n=1 Tax=Thermodesulfobium acidiphilum TaxID=1794699 RepID=A0A2R4W0K6_THEAF|nr:hypothetical protein [Thermodesulfobium acidiphilum]AWB10337.1 hypothetical protein TDSAC_0984 [Thermodesulfobium acidiphilum]